MVCLRFNSLNIFFTFYFLVVLEITRAEATQTEGEIATCATSTAASSSGTFYKTEINGGEVGMKMLYDSDVNSKMSVAIHYDTETKSATDFFQKQFKTDLFQGFTACDIVDWKFMPCGTSRLNNKTELICPKDDAQCKFNKIHACVATIYKQDQQKVGQFVICFFNNNKDVNKCIGQIGLAQNDVDKCAQNKGAFYCDNFFKTIHPYNATVLGRYTGIASSQGTRNFRSVLCDELDAAGLQCKMCPPTIKTDVSPK